MNRWERERERRREGQRGGEREREKRGKITYVYVDTTI